MINDSQITEFYRVSIDEFNHRWLIREKLRKWQAAIPNLLFVNSANSVGGLRWYLVDSQKVENCHSIKLLIKMNQ